MRQKLTLIFDRSAFHGERFDLLKKSQLHRLIKARVLLVHHTPAFLEETVSLYEKPENRDELRAQLPFILDICNGRWFLQAEELWNLELVQHAGPNANVFVKEWRRRDTERRMREGVLGPMPWTELLSSLPSKDAERQKQFRQHALHVEMRKEVADKRKAADVPKHAKPAAASELINHEADSWGWELISRFIHHPDKRGIYCAWKKNKMSCPFFTSFVEGTLYGQWHAMVEYNKKIDLNAQVDIQLLSYLHRADVVVSNDERFLKDAFAELWLPKRKRLFSSEQLVTFLKILQ